MKLRDGWGTRRMPRGIGGSFYSSSILGGRGRSRVAILAAIGGLQGALGGIQDAISQQSEEEEGGEYCRQDESIAGMAVEIADGCHGRRDSGSASAGEG